MSSISEQYVASQVGNIFVSFWLFLTRCAKNIRGQNELCNIDLKFCLVSCFSSALCVFWDSRWQIREGLLVICGRRGKHIISHLTSIHSPKAYIYSPSALNSNSLCSFRLIESVLPCQPHSGGSSSKIRNAKGGKKSIFLCKNLFVSDIIL